MNKKTDFEITFDLWIQDYRIIAWEGLTSDEILCLCKFHRENFFKELMEYKKKGA